MASTRQIDMTYDMYTMRSEYDGKLYIYSKVYPKLDIPDKRIPTTFVCLIDVSGSMQTLCSIASATECDNLSRLDLTKHSLNTIVEMLNENDELILIKFTTEATHLFTGLMDDLNKSEAKRYISNLVPECSTNIFSAVQMGYQYAKNAKTDNIKMLLLTDGESNINPPIGILPSLERLLRSDEYPLVEITTFGFSNDVDSKLLFDISHMTKGSFNFIPDCSMVGTTFINFLANSLTTQYVTYTIEPSTPDAKVSEVSIDIKYELARYHLAHELKDICFSTDCKARDQNDMMKQKFDMLKQHIKSNTQKGLDLFNELYKDFESSDVNDEQITKALTNPEWFKKWGYHYLLSLSSAHRIRKCHNFMDKGVQLYGNSEFENLRDVGTDIFSSLPAPIASRNSQRSYSSYNSTPVATQPVDMSRYVDRNSGCFSPECLIKLQDGSYKKLKDLTKSDKLYEDQQIKYITKIYLAYDSKKFDMVKINDLIITRWHPIYDDVSKEWIFPNDHPDAVDYEYEFDYVMNIILENGYQVEINDFKCVTLGHRIRNYNEKNLILYHPFYTSLNAITNIEQFKTSDDQDIVEIRNYYINRSENGIVTRYMKV